MAHQGPESKKLPNVLAAKHYVEKVLGDRLHYNAFQDRVEYDGQPYTDEMNFFLRDAASRRGIMLSKQLLHDAINFQARLNPYSPPADFLMALSNHWDGVDRLEDVFQDFFGAENTALNRAYSKKWFIQAAARVLEPGIKADHVLVLQGPQGVGKSRFAELIAVESEWFASGLPGLTDQKAAVEKLRGVWIFEVAELNGFKKSEVEKIKEFITMRTDRYRPAYGLTVREFKRTAVFLATTNEEEFLRDSTGNRRFWPIRVTTPLDVELLKAALPQLWAEATVRFLRREPYWLTPEETAEQAISVKRQLYAGPYEEYLAPLFERCRDTGKKHLQLKEVHDFLLSDERRDILDRIKLTTSLLNPSFAKAGWSVYKLHRIKDPQTQQYTFKKCWRDENSPDDSQD